MKTPRLPAGAGTTCWEALGVEGFAFVGRHQDIARLQWAGADARRGALRIQQAAQALADAEPAAAVGSRPVDGADTVGKIALGIGQVKLLGLRARSRGPPCASGVRR